MPFVAYVHADDHDPPPEGPQPWEPNWRVWRWIVAAAFATFGAVRTDGVMETLLVFVVFALICRAALDALPNGDGLRDYRQ
jgi:hypothetical protein